MEYYEKSGHTAFRSGSGTEYYLPESAAIDGIPHFRLVRRCGTNGCRCLYECDGRNAKGERLVVELTFCENFDGRAGLPQAWHRSGKVDHILESWWGFRTYVYDGEGCRGAYDPTVLHYVGAPYDDRGEPSCRLVNDYEWFGEATEGNALHIFAECHRRFMAMEPTRTVGEEYFQS